MWRCSASWLPACCSAPGPPYTPYILSLSTMAHTAKPLFRRRGAVCVILLSSPTSQRVVRVRVRKSTSTSKSTRVVMKAPRSRGHDPRCAVMHDADRSGDVRKCDDVESVFCTAQRVFFGWRRAMNSTRFLRPGARSLGVPSERAVIHKRHCVGVQVSHICCLSLFHSFTFSPSLSPTLPPSSYTHLPTHLPTSTPSTPHPHHHD